MKKIKLNLALDGRHGVTVLPWEGWEYPEIPGLEGIRLCAIRIPDWEAGPPPGEMKPCLEGWKLTEVTTGCDLRSLGIGMWPTRDKLIEKALPVLLCYAEQIREKVEQEHGNRKS